MGCNCGLKAKKSVSKNIVKKVASAKKVRTLTAVPTKRRIIKRPIR